MEAFGIESALAVGGVLVSLGVSWGINRARLDNDDERHKTHGERLNRVETDLDEAQGTLQAIARGQEDSQEEMRAMVQRWNEHEKDAALKRLEYETRMSGMSGKFDVIAEQLRSINEKLQDLQKTTDRRQRDR